MNARRKNLLALEGLARSLKYDCDENFKQNRCPECGGSRRNAKTPCRACLTNAIAGLASKDSAEALRQSCIQLRAAEKAHMAALTKVMEAA